MPTHPVSLIGELSQAYMEQFQNQRVILTFGSFLELVSKTPRALIRSSAEYIKDTFDFFGREKVGGRDLIPQGTRFSLFNLGTDKNGPIVGGENVQEDIYNILVNFVRQGYSNKLILLHGPNGSSKTSTVEQIAWGMQKYSETIEGAVYKFNWIFPTEKISPSDLKGDSGPIGFARKTDQDHHSQSYALLDDSLIASRISSDFKDNPIYLIPMPQREIWLRQWIGSELGIKPDQVELPPHVLYAGLSKRNQLILENLLSAYDGDLAKVLRHVQVERFFYSRQYRVGISTVEPQMAIDAMEKQLTMDRNIQNLPPVLHNIRFFEAHGELIEANRGLLEFSDLLKRPIEAFKYLLTSVEKSSVSLPSSTSNLDILFMATTNEKHLDSFKTVPDFSSFRGRFEMITVPYLLRPSQEVKIYEKDIIALKKSKKICPYTLEMLCLWAVMTRYKQPDADHYDAVYRPLLGRLDPRMKARLYEGESLKNWFKAIDESQIKEIRTKIINESVGTIVYEGRFGASPREIKQILLKSVQNPRHKTVTPMAIFEELDRLVKDRSVYEFLQFEPRGKYHDAALFIDTIRDEFAGIFENETLRAMSMVAEEEYDKLFQKYIENVVADIKRERIYNSATEQYEPANKNLMSEIEKILDIQGSVDRHREGMLSRIASWRIDNPKHEINFKEIFSDYLQIIEDHYYKQSRVHIEKIYEAMLIIDTDDQRILSEKDRNQARETYRELDRRFGYDEISARECLKFMLYWNKQRKK
jgi:serine protein kinase